MSKPVKDVNKEREAKKKAYLEKKANEPKTVELEVEGFTCVLNKPNRGVYSRVIGLITPMAGKEPDLLYAGNVILNSCWVSGDDELKDDETLNIAVCLKAIELIEIKEASLKKN